MATDIWLSLAGGGRIRHQYEVAGLRLGCDLPLGPLEPFAVPGRPIPMPRGAATAGAGETLVYRGPGWVGGRLLPVECSSGGAGYRLQIAGADELRVSADGRRIDRRPPLDGPDVDAAVAAAVLGPCLALALALRGIYCLHASATQAAGRAVALTGESGSGKSTLAAALAAASEARRMGDDVLPLRLAAGRVQALPRFPQPGLPAAEQWRAPAPAEVELAAVYLLEPGAERVATDRLSRREATLALVRQTVAARLFAAELQARHLDACAELALRLPAHRLRFPRRRSALPAMTAAILGREAEAEGHDGRPPGG